MYNLNNSIRYKLLNIHIRMHNQNLKRYFFCAVYSGVLKCMLRCTS